MPTNTAQRTGRLRLSAKQLDTMRSRAREGYPHEVCGVLVGAPGAEETRVAEVREARNLELERAGDRYVLDPEAVHAADRDARAAGLEIVGFWHSHPDAPAVPSETDRSRAWEGYAYAIVSVRGGGPADVRAWWLIDDEFQQGDLIHDE